MKVTKQEIEKLLGYEIANFKITKRTYRGRKIVKLNITVQPKKYSENITVMIRLDN